MKDIIYYSSMLSISHTLTGALIAAKIQNPLLYTPLVLASHYLEDWIPHWDVGTGLSNGKRKRSTALIMEFGELGISVLLIYLFWKDSSPTTFLHAGVGAFIGLVPDFMEAPRNFLKWEPAFLKPLNHFHGSFHHSIPNIVLGLTPQVLLWVLIWWLR